jgi:transcriptional regulator with XRE-family HTH domain
MPRKARPAPKTKRRPTQIRAWRKARGLSLAKLSERLLTMEELDISDAQLSRIERGDQPYSQDLVEALARVLGCTDFDLLWRDPTQGSRWSIWEEASPLEKRQAEAFIETLRRTGTDD